MKATWRRQSGSTQPLCLLRIRFHLRCTHPHCLLSGLTVRCCLLLPPGRTSRGFGTSDPSLGPTTMNVGRIEGGVAANVIAPSAEATLLFRCAAPVDAILAEIRSRVGSLVELEELNRAEPYGFDVLGFKPGPAVPFNTDAHSLLELGASMSLMGPGDMRCAHSAREELAFSDLADGIEAYERVVAGLLGLA